MRTNNVTTKKTCEILLYYDGVNKAAIFSVRHNLPAGNETRYQIKLPPTFSFKVSALKQLLITPADKSAFLSIVCELSYL